MKKTIAILVALFSVSVTNAQKSTLWFAALGDSLRKFECDFPVESSFIEIERRKDGSTRKVEYDNGDCSTDTTFHSDGFINVILNFYFEEWREMDLAKGKLEWIKCYDESYEEHGYEIFFDDGGVSEYYLYDHGEMLESGRFMNGKQLTQRTYTEGLSGTLREFYPNGVVKLQNNFIGKELDGICTMNFENGKPKAILEFEYGVLLRALTYEPDGSPVSTIEEYREKMKFHFCNEDGSVCCECTVKKGKLKCRPMKS